MADLEIVVMLLTVIACLLVAIIVGGAVLLQSLDMILRAIAAQNLHLLEWKENFDAMFVAMDEYDGDDSEEQEIEQWK